MKNRRIPLLLWGVLVACDDGSGSGGGNGGNSDTDATSTGAVSTTTPSTTTSDGQLDTTSSPNLCADDYHGNNEPQMALDLGLDTTSPAGARSFIQERRCGALERS